MNIKKILLTVAIVGIIICGFIALSAIWGSVNGSVILRTFITYFIVLLSLTVRDSIEKWYEHFNASPLMREINYVVFLISDFATSCLLISLTWDISNQLIIWKAIATIGIVNLILIVCNTILEKWKKSQMNNEQPQA